MIERYVAWVRDIALPFWISESYDVAIGRFHERLDLAGRPVALPHRAMVQARQVSVFAQAAGLGWPTDIDRAARAMDNLIRDWCVEGPHGVEIDYAIHPHARGTADGRRDAYTYAFVLFAAAHLYKVRPDPDLLAFAGRLTRFVDGVLADQVHGGLFDAVPDIPTGKSQNPQMHLLEAWLALEEAAPGLGHAHRAADVVVLFRTRMLHGRPAVLPERFGGDWSLVEETATPAFEPGHHFEWSWLLREADRVNGGDHGWLSQHLHASALRYGRADNGLLYDETSIAGPTRVDHRLWPHTEAIKSAAAAHQRGDKDARALADDMAALLLERFVGRPFAAGWIDRIDSECVAIADHVPASSLYHLMMAATEADRTFLRSG